jgi:hypothetical protein
MIKKISTKIQRSLVYAVEAIITSAGWVHAGVVRGLKAVITGIEWLF